MTDQEHLERAYRRLLAWYPPEFRRENEQEILAVLIAGARHGQRRPGLAESADLIRSGLWLRLWPSVPRSARTVRAAVKLMYAGAAVSTVNLVILLALIGDIRSPSAQPAAPTPTVHHGVDSLGPWPRSRCGCGWPGRTAGAGTGRASCPRCCSARRRST